MPTLRPYARLASIPSIRSTRAIPSIVAQALVAIAFPAAAAAQGAPAPTPAVAPAPSPAPARPSPATPVGEPPPKTPAPAPKGDSTDRAPIIPAEVDPAKDLSALERQGDARPTAAKPDDTRKGSSGQVFSDDWWRHTRPIIELHGFFRTRADLFHNFSLGRADPSTSKHRLFPRPADDSYTPYAPPSEPGAPASEAEKGKPVLGCGPTSNPAREDDGACTNKTHASANLRFRIDPEIHISDNLRIQSQVDFLDNLVLGSTPEGYANLPAAGGYSNVGGGGYVPLGAFSQTQTPPVAGVNSLQNSVAVKRVWGEYLTPVGQIRFGRMPSHWGLGVLANAGDKIDSDYQSTADRFMFVTGIKSLDLYVAGAWDFPNSGKTSATVSNPQGQPYNVAQLDNVNQWVLAIFRRVRPELAQQRLARGDVIVNGGAYTVYRQQILSNELAGGNGLTVSSDTYRNGLGRIGARAFIPDLWLQVLTKRLRWETEVVYLYGSIENPKGKREYQREDYKIRQLGIATEFEYRTLNDDLKLRFYSGFASGDQGLEGLTPGEGGLQPRETRDKTVSTFRFHPDYRVDLILFRNILNRVQGAYYFRPGVEYDFTRSADGEKFGGRADIVYSRASKAVQTPGHKADLGLELDLSVYYQSKDGSLNDDPSKIGGFYAMLQYGVLFPLGGLGYQSRQVDGAGKPFDVSTAQTVRLFLGIAY